VRRLLEPTLAAAAALTAARAVRRMGADYWDNETFTPRTVALTYSAAIVNAGAFVLAIRRRSWPLPPRTAVLGGVAVAGAVVTGARHTRNPRYLSVVAALAGVGVVARSGLACVIAAAAWAAAHQPLPVGERHLARTFGDQL
jgi:protein-S-isoprenylcysteine O-methyltransferase Ste14